MRAFLYLACVGMLALPLRGQSPPAAPAAYGHTAASPDGIGAVYMGREIAQVMGHQGAGWLERPERYREEGTGRFLALLRPHLKPDAVVADIGAGSGYFSFRIAPLVPQGKVLAEDIDDTMLGMIDRKRADTKMGNVATVRGTTTDVKLPAGGVDCVVLVDTYHEWDHPREMMASILRALKPGGQVVQLEYRAEDDNVPILPHHKMTAAQARAEMEAAGLRWLETRDDLPQQHLLVYEKPANP